MIEIYIGADSPQDVSHNNLVILGDIKEYISVRAQIREAILASKSLRVWVRIPVCFNWFWDLENLRGITLSRVSLIDQLKSQLNVQSLPSFLYSEPEKIIQWGLLQISEEKLSDESIKDWILRSKLDVVWIQRVPTKEHLVNLIGWYAKYTVPENLAKLTKHQLEGWASEAPSRKIKKFYQELLENAEFKSRSLIYHNMLLNYPRKQRFSWLETNIWFDDALIVPELIEVDFETIPQEMNMNFSIDIGRYWDEYLQELTPDNDIPTDEWLHIIDGILQKMTGNVESEIARLTNFLMNYIENLPSAATTMIAEKFNSLVSADKYITKIQDALPPKYPNTPQKNWELSQWLDWAVYQYLPYRKWILLNQRNDPKMDEFSLMFETWLHENYPKFIAKTDQKLVSNMINHIEKALSTGKRVIWLFLDNLSYFWYTDLIESLEKVGFSIDDSIPQISMIPSITDISRPVALAGKTPSLHYKKGTNNWGRLKSELEELWDDYDVAVVRELRELSQTVSQNPDMVILVYNRIDELMHNKLEISERYAEVKNKFSDMCDEVKLAVERFSGFDEVILFISTDHGCTNINPHSTPLQIPDFVQQNKNMDIHQRYITYEKPNRFDELPWFILDPKNYELPRYYAIPKGRRSVGAIPKGLTHGGLTPEEVIVPFITCQLGLVSTQMILEFEQDSILRVLDKPQRLILKVYNPMNIGIKQLEISIPSCRGVFETIEEISSHFTLTTGTEIILPQITEDIPSIEIIYSAIDTRGARLSASVTINLEVSRIYKSEIDDMFGL